MRKQIAEVKAFHEKNEFEIGARLKQRREEVRVIAGVLQALADHLQRKCEADYDPQTVRAQLILGETAEVIEALGTGNELALLDGIADLLYVAFGAVIQYDLPIEEAFAEVQRSNMTKDAKHGWGSRWKGPTYSAPNLRPILEEHRR